MSLIPENTTSIDTVVYTISVSPLERDSEVKEALSQLAEREETFEDAIIAEVNGLRCKESVFVTTEHLTRVKYHPCAHRNTHLQHKILKTHPYFSTVVEAAEDIDFRLVANLMFAADVLEKINVQVRIKMPNSSYETGHPMKAEILAEAAERKIRLPRIDTFYW